MRHLSVESILDEIENKRSTANRKDVAEHLNACGRCSDRAEEIQQLLIFMSEDAANEPSAESLAWSYQLIQPVLRMETSAGKTRPARRIARLIFDSFEQGLAAGVRSGAPGRATVPRQLVYTAGNLDVDLRIESLLENRVSLSGQVLSEKATPFFENTPVRLESSGLAHYRTQTNRLGEFSFDAVPQDTYHLSMDLPEGPVTLFCVCRGGR
jgi:hypothetical protein